MKPKLEEKSSCENSNPLKIKEKTGSETSSFFT